MDPNIGIFFPHGIGAELIYSFVIIVCSLMIYFSTKEIYELSSYKGLKYFRLSFLFFAIAYFFRYFIRFIIMLFGVNGIFDISPRFIGELSLFGFIYSSSMAIFYLLYSVMWKKWNHSVSKIRLFNIIAMVIGLIGITIHNPTTPLIINIIMLLFVTITLLIAYKDSKGKGKWLYPVYFLLFIFWILNIIDILLPRFLELYRTIIYLISTLLFMTILYKVLRKAGS